MKIGILTLPLGINYGGILQAWALQEVLQSMGHEVVILNRQYGYPSVKLFLQRSFSVLKCIVKRYILSDKDIIINNPLASYYRTYYYDEEDMKKFIHDNFSVSPSLRTSKKLFRYVKENRVEAIVVGSDQVWRAEYSPYITDYFLDFLPKDYPMKRIAYAASFGGEECDIPLNLLPVCMKSLEFFDAVSVREEAGKSLLEKIFSRKASLVLDPTLLLRRQDYEKIMNRENDVQTGGLIHYILDENEAKNQIVNDVAFSLGLSKRQLTISPRDAEGKLGKLDTISFWLNTIANANFVITDSFHGCVFSIIFNKPFIAIANKGRGISRFVTLLGQFGLLGQLIFSLDEYQCKKRQLLFDIDYDSVNIKKKSLIRDARAFLMSSLSTQIDGDNSCN